MKKLVSIFILFCFSAAFCFAQKRATPANPSKPKAILIQTTPAAIPEAEWKNLADLLSAEDWEKSARLASEFINRIKTDNEKKQLAQLRYLYLFALSGKILKLREANDAVAENAVWYELKKSAAAFTGKEFVLPPRKFLGECSKLFNYICTVKGNDKALRSVATDAKGLEIHSFDYVLFDQKIALKEFVENKTFVGGVLRKIEYNDDLEKPWVMRMVFEKGFARVVIGA
ncbi:MAG: hypothetical protein M3033_15080 [Acidobacteriota bacterium]|nr:hypothetical protein [Acidobacteriota bacterium]